MLRRVGDALPDLARDVLDRALTLREHVDDLRATTAPERLRHGRERVEERRLRLPSRHQ